jgi:hypothetical protein
MSNKNGRSKAQRAATVPSTRQHQGLVLGIDVIAILIYNLQLNVIGCAKFLAT